MTHVPGNQDPPPPVQLSAVEVDYHGIYSRLEADLIAHQSWTNLARSGTGITLLRWMASIGAFCQGSVARSLQEAFPDTARSPSGIFRCARLQGIEIIRARPGEMQVTVTRTDRAADNLTVPAYSVWTADGQRFFNRFPFTIPATGAAVQITLHRGNIESQSFVSDGAPFQTWVLGERNLWNISFDDVWMIDSTGVTWKPVYNGLWRENSTSQHFAEKTLPDGRVECKFGDGNYGAIPPSGNLTFGYVTLDSAIETATPPSLGSFAVARDYPVSGIVDASATANQDAPSPEFYKQMGPGGAANYQRAVTRDDHRAVALAYDGVNDAVFQGQAEINPSDVRWMCIISTTLLTTTTWSDVQWLRFKSFMEAHRGMAGMVFVRKDPTPVPITIPVKIRALPVANLNSITSVVRSIVTDFFAPHPGSLGASYAPSDLIVRIMESVTYQQAPNETGPLLDTIEVPMDSIQLPPTSYFVLEKIELDVQYTTRKSNAASLDLIVGEPLLPRH